VGDWVVELGYRNGCAYCEFAVVTSCMENDMCVAYCKPDSRCIRLDTKGSRTRHVCDFAQRTGKFTAYTWNPRMCVMGAEDCIVERYSSSDVYDSVIYF